MYSKKYKYVHTMSGNALASKMGDEQAKSLKSALEKIYYVRDDIAIRAKLKPLEKNLFSSFIRHYVYDCIVTEEE